MFVHTITIGVKGRKGTRTIQVDTDSKSIKLSTMKCFVHASAVFGAMSKGEAHRLRKIIASHGLNSVAAISRTNDAGTAHQDEGCGGLSAAQGRRVVINNNPLSRNDSGLLVS